MKVAVIDGQGGGIGKAIVEKIRADESFDIEIIALGTNAIATTLMMKAGANEGASGENAIVCSAAKVDIITGTIGIILADSMLGEVTLQMAAAVAKSPAKKVLLPLNRCNLEVAGTTNMPLPHYIESAVEIIKNYARGEKSE